jgi:hypothetical protein
MADEKPLKKFTTGELLAQGIKEAAAGLFGNSAAGNAVDIVQRRANDVERSTYNPYKKKPSK